ncbi:hypothetical protein MCP_2801 [Methanocella paludicola SANAE]|uniref:Uncharacterized protein n=1 Tax=Methanocella paludicola (strain DSM 17711 / JCM 13418 / NBRC 101707 / SANAE) TaxID=304371 RepID=D1Z2F1_METPS|nr:hypothetical protein [Methanocella paludicola]BAI62873.1 hypothetical protein MCP_2801 [Methanocella paludicola SANAE]
MKNKNWKYAIVLITLALFLGMTVTIVVAQELPPTPPSDAHSGGNSGSSGSSGSSGGSYNPPVFASYTDPLKSSDGTIIGHLDAKNFNSVLVWAEKNDTVGNSTCVLTVEGELGSMPPDNCWLDINFLSADSAAVPPGMESGLALGVMNITKSPSDWGYKSNPTYTLKITSSDTSVNPDHTYYLVRSSGPDYQLLKLSMSVSGNETTVKFIPPGDAGTFTVIRAPMATPTPTPTPTPEPTATPTPIPENNMWSFPIFIAMFAVGAIAGAAVLYIFNIRR